MAHITAAARIVVRFICLPPAWHGQALLSFDPVQTRGSNVTNAFIHFFMKAMGQTHETQGLPCKI